MKRLIDILAAGVKDADGTALASGTVEFYEPGTTTRKTVYQEFALTTAHDNPATLSSAGHLIAYHDGRTDYVIRRSDGSLVSRIYQDGMEDEAVTSALGVSASTFATTAGSGLEKSSGGVFSVDTDDTTITKSGNAIAVKVSGVSTAKFADGAVTQSKRGSLNYAISETTAGAVSISGITVTITSLSGRPFFIFYIPDGSTSPAEMPTVAFTHLRFYYRKDGGALTQLPSNPQRFIGSVNLAGDIRVIMPSPTKNSEYEFSADYNSIGAIKYMKMVVIEL